MIGYGFIQAVPGGEGQERTFKADFDTSFILLPFRALRIAATLAKHWPDLRTTFHDSILRQNMTGGDMPLFVPRVRVLALLLFSKGDDEINDRTYPH